MKRLAAAGLACALLAACDGPRADEGAANGEATGLRAADSAPVEQAPPAFAAGYPGGEIITTIAAVENGRPGGIFAFRTDDSPAQVLAFYRERARAAGMTAPRVASADEIFMAQGEGGDVTVTTTEIDGRTHAQVTWTSRQAAPASAAAATT